MVNESVVTGKMRVEKAERLGSRFLALARDYFAVSFLDIYIKKQERIICCCFADLGTRATAAGALSTCSSAVC